MQKKSPKSVTWICSERQKKYRWCDKDPKKTEEALNNSFAALDNLKCAATSKEHGSNVISLCVAPVKLKHEHCANKITTYAMLDNCSQGSFIHDSLVKKLGVTGIKTTINLKTLHGVRSEKTISVEGIKVSQLQGNSSWLNLPKMYARRSLPMDKEEIVTPARISKWEYLKPISNEIVQDEDIAVGLLIGALYECLIANGDNPKQGRWSLCIQDLVGMVHCGTYYQHRRRKEY